MRKLTLFILTLVLILGTALNAVSITVEELNALVPGDFVHIKLEWNSRVYLEGDAVVGYVKDDVAVVISTSPTNPFYYGASGWAITAKLPNPTVDKLATENNLLKIDNNILRETIKNSNVGVLQTQVDLLNVKLRSLGPMLLELQAQLNSRINSMMIITSSTVKQ